jgi:cupin fold WbuC family metalloprotein
MLNAIEPGSELPVHRHRFSSETVVILRGHLRETFYDPGKRVTAVYDLVAGGDVVALNIPLGQWHTAEAVESGTVIIEMKDGPYVPTGPEEIMTL